MRRLLLLATIALTANAQTTANPVVTTAKEIFARQSKFIVAAAEEMPAEKYSYHPTPDQWSFAKISAHIALSGNAICGDRFPAAHGRVQNRGGVTGEARGELIRRLARPREVGTHARRSNNARGGDWFPR